MQEEEPKEWLYREETKETPRGKTREGEGAPEKELGEPCEEEKKTSIEQTRECPIGKRQYHDLLLWEACEKLIKGVPKEETIKLPNEEVLANKTLTEVPRYNSRCDVEKLLTKLFAGKLQYEIVTSHDMEKLHGIFHQSQTNTHSAFHDELFTTTRMC